LIDGYPLQADATLGASDSNPLSLPLAPPGEAAATHFAAACRAGAPLPPGADAVLPIDAVEASAGMVEVSEPAPGPVGAAGQFYRRRRSQEDPLPVPSACGDRTADAAARSST